MKIDLPPDIYGGNPAGFIDYCGLAIKRPPTGSDTVWEVSARPATLVTSQVLCGPALKKPRFDTGKPPTPTVPGGMPPELAGEFKKHTQRLDKDQTLAALLERITSTLVAVPDHQVPDAIVWASETFTEIPLTRSDGSTEPLFPRHSVHDIRINHVVYSWTKLPQIFLRLEHNTLAEVAAESHANSKAVVFRASEAFLEGTIFGGLYFTPLLGNMFPSMWGMAAPRIGQVIVYTFGRVIGGNGLGSSRDQRDVLQILGHHNPSRDFDTEYLDETKLHKALFSEAVDWWASRVDRALLDIFSPATYVDAEGFYLPAMHQRWMLNFEGLLSRIGAIIRNPRDQAAQLMLMYPAMDILGDSFTGSHGIAQLMIPSRIRKVINEIQKHVPHRIMPLIMASAHRALAATEQVADEFIVDSPNPDATTNSRLLDLWNALRNNTHGFNNNADILAEHSCRLPADIVLVPMVYLLHILTDRQRLLERIDRVCREERQKSGPEKRAGD